MLPEPGEDLPANFRIVAVPKKSVKIAAPCCRELGVGAVERVEIRGDDCFGCINPIESVRRRELRQERGGIEPIKYDNSSIHERRMFCMMVFSDEEVSVATIAFYISDLL